MKEFNFKNESKIGGAKIAIVISRFNESVTSKLLAGSIERLKEKDIPGEAYVVVWVPGAVEIPFVAQRLAQSGKYGAIIALGAVIRGETSHYDYVCEQASQWCQRVMLENDIPVIFAVLTTENEEQAWDRVGGKHGHKGRDAVDAALEMIVLLRELQ